MDWDVEISRLLCCPYSLLGVRAEVTGWLQVASRHGT